MRCCGTKAWSRLEFLDFLLARGGDLITPRRKYRFAGLQPGDCWCLCAMRWKEALVVLESSHKRALLFVTLG